MKNILFTLLLSSICSLSYAQTQENKEVKSKKTISSVKKIKADNPDDFPFPPEFPSEYKKTKHNPSPKIEEKLEPVQQEDFPVEMPYKKKF